MASWDEYASVTVGEYREFLGGAEQLRKLQDRIEELEEEVYFLRGEVSPSLRNEWRDAWLVNKRRGDITLERLFITMNELAPRRGWQTLGSISSMCAAMKRHIRRHPELEPLPKRKAGRPPRSK